MITQEIFYAVKCNRCLEIHSDGEHEYWIDENTAVENAYNSEWSELKNKHYCPNCHEQDEETGEIKVHEDIPEPIKIVKRFIQKTLCFYVALRESETEFIFNVKNYSKRELSDSGKDFIIEQIKDKITLFTSEKDRWNQERIIIKVSK